MSTDPQAHYSNQQQPHPGHQYVTPSFPMYSMYPPQYYNGGGHVGYSTDQAYHPNYIQNTAVHVPGVSQARYPVSRPPNETSVMSNYSHRQQYGTNMGNMATLQPQFAGGQHNLYQMPMGHPHSTSLNSQGFSLMNANASPTMATEHPPNAPLQANQKQEKRIKTPIDILNPVSKERVEINGNKSSNTSSENAAKKSGNDLVENPSDRGNKTTQNKAKDIQDEFRKGVMDRMSNTTPQTGKKQSETKSERSVNEERKESVSQKMNEASNVSASPPDPSWDVISSTLTVANEMLGSGSLSSDELQLVHQETRVDETNKDKQIVENVDNNQPVPTLQVQSEQQISSKPIVSKPIESSNVNAQNTTTKANDETQIPEINVSTTSTDNKLSSQYQSAKSTDSESSSVGKTSSVSKRASYTIEELLKKRSDPISQMRPMDLKHIEGVTVLKSSPNHFPFRSSSPVPSRHSVTLEKLVLQNRAENPYKAADRNRIDADEKFLREVKAILNKLTPQTYEKLLEKLETLELTSESRLNGMIGIIFGKAVEEPTFCTLYANLCKHFQRKQVTVPNADGQMNTYIFRQILLTRCQKEFESDYRQEIQYETRQKEVEAITDEKLRREASETLEEDLGKAKRKKLGNIIFIGELFKLQMLTEKIMYDCVDLLLCDKTDEESLECLCRLLTTIGKELDVKANSHHKNLEKNFTELAKITTERYTSARTRFMIQDVLEQRKANWISRRTEVKPLKIDDIHKQERVKREQQEIAQERDRQRREQNRSGNPQHYTETRSNRGSGIKQYNNRNEDEREPRFNVNSLRQLQTNDKKNQGTAPLSFAPQYAWSKGSNAAKKVEDDRSYDVRSVKPNVPSGQQSKSKNSSSPITSSGYSVQHQSSQEVGRDNNQRNNDSGSNNSQKTNGITASISPESSHNISRERSNNNSRESSVVDRASNSNALSTSNSSEQKFDESKTQTCVESLIKEFTENFSETSDRPVKEALEDLAEFSTPNVNHQAIIVRELFYNVFEAKPRARMAVGHLLSASFQMKILSEDGIFKGFQLIVEATPDFEVDIPLIWRYICEIVAAFVSAPSSTMSFLKPLMEFVPSSKIDQFFSDCIRSATEFSSKSNVERLWHSSGLSLTDFFKSDHTFLTKYDWLNKKDNNSPCANPTLINMFKLVNEQNNSDISTKEILNCIDKNINKDKFYIRNIVLSYLEACLVNRAENVKIQDDISQTQVEALVQIIDHKLENEIQAVYAVQNFVHKLQHPNKMANLLFDLFYDHEYASEESFFAWRDNPDQSETEGHSIVVISTKDFFDWLKSETDDEEKVEGGDDEAEENKT